MKAMVILGYIDECLIAVTLLSGKGQDVVNDKPTLYFTFASKSKKY